MSRTAHLTAALSITTLLLAACSDDEGSSAAADTGGAADATGETGTDTGIGQDAGLDAPPDEDAPIGDIDLTACLQGDTVDIVAGQTSEVRFDVGGDRRVAVRFHPDSGAPGEAEVQCVEELVVTDGFQSLSPALRIGFNGVLERYARVTLPFDPEAMPAGAGPQAIRVFLAPQTGAPPLSPVAVDLQENMGRGFVSFGTRHPGVYQVGIAADAGQTYERTWRFRAITGISMGCSGASMIGLRHPEAFDIIGALGGPTSWTYLTHYVEAGALGGFNPAPDYGPGDPFAPTQEFEHSQSFDNFWFPTGEGTGGTFDRAEYIKIIQDLSLAFGNTANYSDVSPYFPPGIDVDELTRAPAERCPGAPGTTTTIESGFFDDEYNPDGSMPVIMFCDGVANQDRTIPFDRYCDLDDNGVPDEPNRGLYPGPEGQNRPVVIGWAVDVNGNGQRDLGEPVIRNFHEPYEDVGLDGIASPLEEGYDPQANPDPSGDDYDYFLNPTGTEGNWLRDEGEPFRDVGLDGVADTPQLDEGGYDFGEDNSAFDYNPHLAALLRERDPHQRAAQLTGEEWDNLTIYMDAGVRDLFNFGVSGNQLVGAVQAAGENVRVYSDFFSLANLDPEEDQYRFADVNYDELGDHVYLRYGSLDADEESICLGDGKHVGTVPQVANRLLTLLGFITNRFPEGDLTTLEPPYPTPSGTYRFYSEALGAWEQYSVILPPGYEWSACNDNEDNDGDGLFDGADPECEHGVDNSEEEGLGAPLCSDGLDNDSDQLIDAEDPDCAGDSDTSEWPADSPLRNARFPVVYLLHGYGQTPDELRATVVPFAGFMAGGVWQKVIVVYPDGFCGDNDINQCNDRADNDGDELIDSADPDCAASGGAGEDGVAHPRCSDGVDNDGDGLVDMDDGGCVHEEAEDESECVKGNFYTDHSAWPDGSSPGPAFESALFDLLDHVDAVYRTRAPETTTEVR